MRIDIIKTKIKVEQKFGHKMYVLSCLCLGMMWLFIIFGYIKFMEGILIDWFFYSFFILWLICILLDISSMRKRGRYMKLIKKSLNIIKRCEICNKRIWFWQDKNINRHVKCHFEKMSEGLFDEILKSMNENKVSTIGDLEKVSEDLEEYINTNLDDWDKSHIKIHGIVKCDKNEQNSK